MQLIELEEAYSKHYPRWVAVARRQLSKTPALKSETPEDVVQAVVSHLMSTAGEGEAPRYVWAPSGEEFNGYMHGCIMNRIHDLVRRAIDIQAPAHEEVGYMEQGKPSPLERAESVELRETIQRVINTFPAEGTRQFLRLVYLEDWTQKEAEAKMGYQNMRSTCFRFRERLAEELRGEEEPKPLN